MQLSKNTLYSNNAIKEVINYLEVSAKRFGIDFSGYTQISINKFYLLPVQAQIAIIQSIEFLTSILHSINPEIDRTRFEVESIYKTAKALKLKIPDDFLDVIEQGDIVEIYDFRSQTQVYRNLEFLRISSYDLLTAIVTPFPELFERDEKIGPLLIKRTEEAALKQTSVKVWDIPDHQLTEKLHINKRIFNMKMKYISPIYSEIDNSRIAWASTLRATLIGSVFDSTNVKPILN